MAAPDLTVVKAYLGKSTSKDDDTIQSALSAETAAQARACRVPSDPDAQWPADLVEALCRRVAVNLANRTLPLGVQQAVSELNASQVRVGGLDREVRRLEAPHRKLVVG